MRRGYVLEHFFISLKLYMVVVSVVAVSVVAVSVVVVSVVAVSMAVVSAVAQSVCYRLFIIL